MEYESSKQTPLDNHGDFRREENLTILDSVPALIWFKDKQNRHVWCNRLAAELTGLPREAIVGTSAWDLFPRESAERFYAEDLEVINSGEAKCGIVEEVISSSGERRWHRTDKLPHFDREGRIAGVVIFSVDMTERKRAEEEKARLAAEVERERRRLSSIVANVPGVVWEAWGEPDAAEQRIDFVSDHVETMLGHTIEEWLATPNFWLQIVHPEDRERAARVVAEQFAEGEGGVNQFRWVAKDGRVLWAEAHASVIKDESGRPMGMRGVTMDITERKRAEEALRESEDRYRDLVDNSHELICTHDLEGRVLTANPWAALVLGVAQDSLIGMDIRTGLAPEHRHKFDDYLEKIKREGSAQGVMQVRTAAGEKRIWEYHNTLRTRGVETPIVRGMAHDVTERRQALAREREARKEAEEANRLKDDFLATLSHELRTPLTSILGWSSMLRQGMLDEDALQSAMEAINRNARAQAQIIDDLLDVSRIITGQLRLDVQPVELTSVVGAAVESIRPAAEAKDIRLLVEPETELGGVLGDPMRLQQVIWNLLVNAVKFTPAGGEVRVSLGRADSAIRLSVTDTGCGIDPEFIPFVFDRFRQADGTATRRHGGLGLGLALVRHLVELHGGTVRVESAGAGRGAKFILDLPAAVRKEGAGTERANQTIGNKQSGGAVRPSGLGGLRVLLVEDDGDSRMVLNLALEAYGAVVDTASSASEALARIKEARPDVLVSDIGMPDVDGYELIRRVRELPPENGGLMPALALTGYAGEKDRERAILAGFQEHVSKPVEPNELAAIVAKLGQHRRGLSW